MFYSYFYKISFRILKNHRFYKKTGASWFYYHSHSCTTFNLCISSACLRPNLMPLGFDLNHFIHSLVLLRGLSRKAKFRQFFFQQIIDQFLHGSDAVRSAFDYPRFRQIDAVAVRCCFKHGNIILRIANDD